MGRGRLRATVAVSMAPPALTSAACSDRHGLRGGHTPTVTQLGVDGGTLLGGAIFSESVFGLPGLGRPSPRRSRRTYQ